MEHNYDYREIFAKAEEIAREHGWDPLLSRVRAGIRMMVVTKKEQWPIPHTVEAEFSHPAPPLSPHVLDNDALSALIRALQAARIPLLLNKFTLMMGLHTMVFDSPAMSHTSASVAFSRILASDPLQGYRYIEITWKGSDIVACNVEYEPIALVWEQARGLAAIIADPQNEKIRLAAFAELQQHLMKKGYRLIASKSPVYGDMLHAWVSSLDVETLRDWIAAIASAAAKWK